MEIPRISHAKKQFFDGSALSCQISQNIPAVISQAMHLIDIDWGLF